MASNARGTHVIQNVIKMLNSEAEEDAIIKKVKVAGIHYLVNNQNSIHVIIQLVNKVHPASTEFILEYIKTLLWVFGRGLEMVRGQLNLR